MCVLTLRYAMWMTTFCVLLCWTEWPLFVSSTVKFHIKCFQSNFYVVCFFFCSFRILQVKLVVNTYYQSDEWYTSLWNKKCDLSYQIHINMTPFMGVDCAPLMGVPVIMHVKCLCTEKNQDHFSTGCQNNLHHACCRLWHHECKYVVSDRSMDVWPAPGCSHVMMYYNKGPPDDRLTWPCLPSDC